MFAFLLPISKRRQSTMVRKISNCHLILIPSFAMDIVSVICDQVGRLYLVFLWVFNLWKPSAFYLWCLPLTRLLLHSSYLIISGRTLSVTVRSSLKTKCSQSKQYVSLTAYKPKLVLHYLSEELWNSS